MALEIVLVDWSDRPDFEGPRLLGRLRDPDLVEAAQDRLTAATLRHLAAIRPPVQLARDPVVEADES
jgi:hypothetical protein